MVSAGAELASGRVTVVIPTRNRAALLAQAIDSALGQTAAERCDVVVVDDGSTDDTPAVARRYGSRIRYIRQRQGGVSAARNTAVYACPNEFTAFLDDDDLWAAEKIERQLAALARWPEAVLVTNLARARSADGRERLHGVPAIRLDGPTDLAPPLFENNFVPTPTVMVRTRALHAVGLFDTRLRCAEDGYTWARLACRGPGVFLAEPLTTFRAATDGLSGDLERLLRYQLRIRYRLASELRRRPDCRPHWHRGLARALTDLRDLAYRRGDFATAARYGLHSLLHRPWGRSRWEWYRLIESACRAAFGGGQTGVDSTS